MTIQELHEKYFCLYSDLFQAQPYLPEKQFETMHKALFNDYTKELEFVVGEKELKTGQTLFEMRFRLKNYLPRRKLLRWNKIAKQTLKRLKAEFLQELSAIQSETLSITEKKQEELPEREDVQTQLPAVNTTTEIERQ